MVRQSPAKLRFDRAVDILSSRNKNFAFVGNSSSLVIINYLSTTITSVFMPLGAIRCGDGFFPGLNVLVTLTPSAACRVLSFIVIIPLCGLLCVLGTHDLLD